MRLVVTFDMVRVADVAVLLINFLLTPLPFVSNFFAYTLSYISLFFFEAILGGKDSSPLKTVTDSAWLRRLLSILSSVLPPHLPPVKLPLSLRSLSSESMKLSAVRCARDAFSCEEDVSPLR